MQDGTRAIAVRTQRENLPIDALDAEGIIVQNGAKGVFILSDRLLPISKRTWNAKNGYFTPWTGQKIGRLLVSGDLPVSGTIFSTSSGIEIRMRKKIDAEFSGNIPDSTFAFLSTPVLPKELLIPITNSMDVLLSGLNSPNAGWLAQKVLNNQDSSVILTSDSTGIGYLLSFSAVSEEDSKDFLRTLASIHQPGEREWMLPDRTSVIELIIDPSVVSVEESTVLGVPVFSTHAEGQTYFTFNHGDVSFITNRESFVKGILSQGEQTSSSLWCGQPILGANLSMLAQHIVQDGSYYSVDILRSIASHYPMVSMRNTMFGSAVDLCQSCCG
jgi:hypothetical protein